MGFSLSRRNITVLSLILLVSLAFFCGCKGEKEYKDGVGRTFTLKAAPERIVSLSPAHTETVFALGLGDKLVGRTTYCDRPQEALEIQSVGDAFNLNLEKIVSLKPDIVLCAGSKDFEAQHVTDIERLGIPVYVSGPSTVDEVLSDIKLLSSALGVKEEGKILSERLKKEIEGFDEEDIEEKPTVFFALDKDLWTVGPGSFIDDVIEVSGGHNVVSDLDTDMQYLQISMEELLRLDPQILLIAVPEEEAATLFSLPGWDALSGRRAFVDADLVSRPGPSVVEGIFEVREAIK